MSEIEPPGAGDVRRARASELLSALISDWPSDRMTLGELMHGLGDRSFGLLLFLIAIPNVVGVALIPGASTVLAVPLVILGWQLVVGARDPWLPAALARRSMAKEDLVRLLARALPWIVRAEKWLRPRWLPLTAQSAARAIGALVIVMALVLALPIAGGNWPPGLAISLFGLALAERDGAFAMAGLFATVAAVLIVGSIIGVATVAAIAAWSYLFG